MEIYLDYNEPVNINVTEDNIHIEDSYKITETSKMKNILLIIKNKYSIYECGIIHIRSINSLVREWQAHNILYKLHIARSHTKSVDLNDERWYRILGYNIIYFVSKLLNCFVSK